MSIPDVEQILGRGSFGIVYRGLLHGTHVAVKVVRYAEDKRADARGFVQEVALMTKLHHPNICLILGVARDEARRTLSIVTELLSVGSLCVSSRDSAQSAAWWRVFGFRTTNRHRTTPLAGTRRSTARTGRSATRRSCSSRTTQADRHR